jgi:hypothetical protein
MNPKETKMPKRFGHIIKDVFNTFAQVNREKATEMLDFELKELENIFALLILGGFVGLPSPPSPIAVELLPYMERELIILLSRSDLSQDPLGVLESMLQID